MSISTYAELKTALTNWSKRSDLTAQLGDFIALAESDMQVRLKLVDFEDISTVSVVAGVGPVPTGFNGARSAYWDGNLDTPVKYIPPSQFDTQRNKSGTPAFFTVVGTDLLVSPSNTGDLVVTHKTRFVPLSDVATTNVLLNNFPDAYLHGSLAQLYSYCYDTQMAAFHGALFDNAVKRIIKDNIDRKYPGPIAVRAM